MSPAQASPRPLPVLNCDLGEGETDNVTDELMALIGAANIACAVHAGSEASMRHALASARRHHVLAGAHPGLGSGFGRNTTAVPRPAELQRLVIDQVGHLDALARQLHVPLHHVKLHGALYHHVDSRFELRTAYLDVLQQHFPKLVVIARFGAACAAEAKHRGLVVWEEAFLDRGYRPDGTLVPRGEAGDLITDPIAIRSRLESLVGRGGWPAHDGTWIPLTPQTLCVHGDSPQAARCLQAAKTVMAPP